MLTYLICPFQDYHNLTGPIASTLAHNIGHNFGFPDDTHECDCPDVTCIMSVSERSVNNCNVHFGIPHHHGLITHILCFAFSKQSRVLPTRWSSCTRRQLDVAINRSLDYCLHNLPVSTYSGATCGNGVVELGEECDCGTPQVVLIKCTLYMHCNR